MVRARAQSPILTCVAESKIPLDFAEYFAILYKSNERSISMADFTFSNTPQRDLILEVATTSFARYGYHGTSIRDLAKQVGISISTLYYYFENKDQLYRCVFERQFQEEQEIILGFVHQIDESVIRNPLALRDLLFRLMDALIDRSLQNPDIVRLWTRRWLEKPEQTKDIEIAYSAPLYKQVENILAKAQEAGVIKPRFANLAMIAHSFTWLQYGYIGFGQLTYQARFEKPFDPQQAAQFRQFVHQLYADLLNFQTETSQT